MEVGLADKIVKCICILYNTIVEKQRVERHLTDVTVQSKSVAWEQRGRLPTEAKTLEIYFLCIWKNIPYNIIKK